MSLDDHIGQLVRDAIEPMLSELEQRLVERLDDLVQPVEPTSTPDLLTAKELAGYLRISPRNVHRMKDDIPDPVRVTPGRPLWRRSDIDAWLDQGGVS